MNDDNEMPSGGASPPPGDESPYHADMGLEFIERERFVRLIRGPTLATSISFGCEISNLDLLDGVVERAEALGGVAKVSGFGSRTHIVNVFDDAGAPLVQAQVEFHSHRPIDARGRNHFEVELAGRQELVLRLREVLKTDFGEQNLATVHWWFERGDKKIDCRSIVMEPPKPVYDEFYPFLKDGVENFIDRYLESPASILFMLGPPGTGKTSLARHLIYSRGLAATLTFDEALLKKDEVFIDFMLGTESEYSVMLIEDADTMLNARSDDGNRMMSRFLNISDGLIRTSGKKVIFTTNLGNFDMVDPALIRRGRCFGAIEFRALTPSEASAAAKVAGLPMPPPEKNVTLAELFNDDQMSQPKLRKFGVS